MIAHGVWKNASIWCLKEALVLHHVHCTAMNRLIRGTLSVFDVLLMSDAVGFF